jgi:chromosome segregation ATPase
LVSNLSERARKDGEEAAQVKKERDELCQRDTEARQQILNLQGKLEKEKGLKLAAEEKVTTLEAKARQDATVAERLRKERDDLRQTETRLRRECNGARQERDGTQERVSSLQSDLERERVQKLEAEGISARLAKDLA